MTNYNITRITEPQLEGENRENKPKIKVYHFEDGNYLRTVTSAKGYACDASISGENIQFEVESEKDILPAFVNSLTKEKIIHQNKASTLEGIALSVELNGLKVKEESGDNK
jgi:hypothetical protein